MAGRGGQGEGVKEGRGGRERGRPRKRRRRAEGDAGKREEVPVAAGRGASPSPDDCGREGWDLVGPGWRGEKGVARVVRASLVSPGRWRRRGGRRRRRGSIGEWGMGMGRRRWSGFG